MKKISKAAMERLMKSKFFHEVEEVVIAWDYYLAVGDKDSSNEMMHKWEIAKLALEHITGNLYGFSRNGETYSIVNERNYDERILIGYSMKREEVAA
jgi:hypothetical protein